MHKIATCRITAISLIKFQSIEVLTNSNINLICHLICVVNNRERFIENQL